MNRYTALIGMLLFACIGATAQDIRMVDSIYFRSEVQADGGRYLPFGVGSMYTDGVDPGTRDFEVPFAPPSGLYALMVKEDGAYYEGDLRAVPDSVEEGANWFSLTYKVHLQRGTGRKIIIDFVKPFAPGIDSVNMRDLLTGTLYNHTFLTGVSEDTLHVEGITQLQVTVYYNLMPSAVEYVRERSENRGRLIPNPVSVHEGIRYSGELPRGGVMLVSNLLGQTVASLQIEGTGSNERFDLSGLAPALYFCTILDGRGVVIDRESFVVVP